MDEMNKKVLMKLLEKLMSEMDDYEAKELNEPAGDENGGVAVIEEKQVVPVEEAPDVIEEKMQEVAGDGAPVEIEKPEGEMPAVENDPEKEKMALRMKARGQFGKSLRI